VPKKLRTPAEEVENLNRRATETANRAMAKVIATALKMKPGTIKPLFDKLASMGITSENVHLRDGGPMSFQAQAIVNRGTGAKVEQAAQDEVGDAAGSPRQGVHLITEAIPTKYYKLGDFSTVILRERILPAIEPVALSAGNLRGLKERGSCAKEVLLDCLEFATGRDRGFKLVGPFSVLPCFASTAHGGQHEARPPMPRPGVAARLRGAGDLYSA
jgi:hypothetical protein